MEIFNSYRDHYRNFDIPEECEETEFNLELPFSDNWKESPNRMMIIIGHVDRDDLIQSKRRM